MPDDKKLTLRVNTPEAILSFPRLDKASKVDPTNESEEAKYSAVLIFTKESETDFAEMKAVITEVGIARFGKGFKEGVKLGQIKIPLRTGGNEKYFPKGCTYISPRSKNKPGLVMPYPDESGLPSICKDPEIFYAGARVRASLTAFAYDRLGNKGVSFGLNSLQWIGDGTRLDGGDPQQDFDTLEEAPMSQDSADSEKEEAMQDLLG